MIGIRQGGKLWLVCQRGCNPTVVKAWRGYLGSQETTFLSAGSRVKGIICHEVYCKIMDKKLLVVLKPTGNQIMPADLCRGAVLEISLLWNQPLCPLLPVIDKRTNWIEGAHSVWLTPLRIETDLSKRGDRPWVMEPIYRGIPNLPVAARD